jgi:hypothetical protein
MRTIRFGFTMLALVGFCCLNSVAHAQTWSNSWASPYIYSHTNTGYVVGATPNVAATAPNGTDYTCGASVEYTNTMSANGNTNNLEITWTVTYYGSSVNQANINSGISWPGGSVSDSRNGANVSYSHGPTANSNHTIIQPPGGSVVLNVYAYATCSSYPGSSASAFGGASGNFP